MTLIKAIKAAGMAEELKAHATPARLNSELMHWLKSHPKLKSLVIEWPTSIKSLRYVRKHFDCAAGRGGVRPQGLPFYNVRHLKNRAQARLTA